MMNSRVRRTPARGRGFVAALGLEVVEDLRQVAVGAHDLGDVGGDDLLVGERQHQVRALAVLELEQLVDVVAARAPPDLGRVQDRHQHLVRADRVEFLAHDLHRLLLHAPARREPAPEARADLADHARADEQLVRERLRIGGRLLLGGEEVLTQTRHGKARSLVGALERMGPTQSSNPPGGFPWLMKFRRCRTRSMRSSRTSTRRRWRSITTSTTRPTWTRPTPRSRARSGPTSPSRRF